MFCFIGVLPNVRTGHKYDIALSWGLLPGLLLDVVKSAVMRNSFPPKLPQNSLSAVSPAGGYELALRLREMAIAADLDVPRYLLAPEIAVLLHYLRQRMLIETLWNTGARINEALAMALTPSDFFSMPICRS